KEFAVLCLLRVLDPLNYTQIFSYINELIWNLRVTQDPKQIGYYSGVVESVFTLAQLVAMYPWGVLFDTAGRRPAILAGAAGLTLTTVIFGLSQDFKGIPISRSFAGLFWGNIAVIPSVLCEITNKRNEAVAYSLSGIFWPIGAVLGPMIGGTLSNSTIKFSVFFNYTFLQKYPYFLPCCVAAGFNVLGLILCYFFLNEMLLALPLDARSRDCVGTQSTTTRGYGVISHQKSVVPTPMSEERYDIRQLLSIPIIQAICTSACVQSFISTAFEVVLVFFCPLPIEKGGLDFPTHSESGSLWGSLGFSGVGATLLSALIMPRILVRLDHSRLYHFGMEAWNGRARPADQIKLWIGIAILLAVVRVVFIGFPINMLLRKASVPGPTALGATYGPVFHLILRPDFRYVSAPFLVRVEASLRLLRVLQFAICDVSSICVP
ncbi:hypothetical protein AN958_04207, partial [Leucoagaricus sp. SymC.cos]